MILVLMGYMGSGKSVVGTELAKVLGYEFCDLDAYISNKLERSISDVFATKGEIYFRKQETIALQEVLQSKTNVVVSLGGGTPCYGQNIEMIKSTNGVVSFYLETSIPELTSRLFSEKSKRPMIAHLKTESELTEFIGKHLFERRHYYAQSDYNVTTNGKSVSEVIENITFKLIEKG